LSNKEITWDVLRRKGREGLGRCYLCKEEEETNCHLAVFCSYTISVWKEIERKLNMNDLFF